MPFGVVQRQHGLEPAGHGVGQVGDQLPRGGGDDQPLALAGVEGEAVDVAGHDLAVDDHRQLVADDGIGRLVVGLGLAGLGQLADVETDRIGHARGGDQAQLALAGLGVFVDA